MEDDVDKAMSAGGDMCENAPRRISRERRRELIALAGRLADEVEKNTQPHERCVLRRLTEYLLGD